MNAGDAGEPPRVQWMPVEGLAIGPMQFPVPSRLPVGPMMDYGYEGVAIFPYNVKTSAALASAKIRVAAWLVCREVCLPGKAFLGVDLPVTPGASGGTKRVIDEAVHAEPTEIPAAVKIEVTGIRRIGA